LSTIAVPAAKRGRCWNAFHRPPSVSNVGCSNATNAIEPSLHLIPSNRGRSVGLPENSERQTKGAQAMLGRHDRSAMHRLRFSNEAGGDRAERCRPRFTNVYLRALQEGSAAPRRQHRARGLAGAATCQPRGHLRDSRRVHDSETRKVTGKPCALNAGVCKRKLRSIVRSSSERLIP
jgi:hypothetical protein